MLSCLSPCLLRNLEYVPVRGLVHNLVMDFKHYPLWVHLKKKIEKIRKKMRGSSKSRVFCFFFRVIVFFCFRQASGGRFSLVSIVNCHGPQNEGFRSYCFPATPIRSSSTHRTRFRSSYLRCSTASSRRLHSFRRLFRCSCSLRR